MFRQFTNCKEFFSYIALNWSQIKMIGKQYIVGYFLYLIGNDSPPKIILPPSPSTKNCLTKKQYISDYPQK